jgi:hypothetical protein
MVLKFVLTFGAGVYTGVYVSQNYDVPQVWEPRELLDRLKNFVTDMNDKYKKTDDNKKDDKN